ncbi:hypothetical protein [Amycolatopsis sp. DSM 110486]|uniref:hypothetical protein n=1 Tax=Amycolatopsis sp. DSM 110486 TaxID=2865832 RepID=UPI001C69C4E4|nr:hypothetical protein [Amycolatopsis sp. DSM 110486]QYN17494.1 hypothetical protein K1T34_32430 [Amycolatopsis sp. DSM 110486]
MTELDQEMTELFRRAAEGDQAAADRFWELRALRMDAREQVTAAGRAHALAMLRRPFD